MLTADAGPSLRALLEEKRPVPAWEAIVALYAELQIDLAGAIDEFLALGVPDSRPATLGHPVGGSLPLTLIHEEVQDGNVHVQDGRPIFIDWAEASVSHPFAGMTNTLRIVGWRSEWEPGGPETLRLRDAYLEPWTRFAPIGRAPGDLHRGLRARRARPGGDVGAHARAALTRSAGGLPAQRRGLAGDLRGGDRPRR